MSIGGGKRTGRVVEERKTEVFRILKPREVSDFPFVKKMRASPDEYLVMDWRSRRSGGRLKGISATGKRADRAVLRIVVIAAVAGIVGIVNGCNRHANYLPLSCPAGATLMGAPPPKGEEVWCQKMVGGKAVKDGVFVAYGTGADRMIQGYYRDGVQEGEWTTWYENGQRSAVDYYRDGVQDGVHTSWYANGVKALEGRYRGGKREGVWTRWDPTGLSSQQEVYRDDRKVAPKPTTQRARGDRAQ